MDGSITSNNELNDIAYHDGKWVAAGVYNIGHVIVLYSTDGINWLQGDGLSSYSIETLTYDDGQDRFYASNIGNGWGMYSVYDIEGKISFSSLGSSTGGYYGVADDGGSPITRLIGGSYNTLKYSTDGGSSWTSATTFPTGQTIRGIAYDGSLTWVAVGSGASAIMYSIDGGVTWTMASTFDNSEYYFDVIYDSKSNRFVAVGNDGLISYSSDGGYSWTASSNTGTTSLFFYGIDAGQ